MNQDKNNDDPISRIEISVKNAQNDIRKLFLHSTRQEIAIGSLDAKIEALDQKVEDRFNQQGKRFDQLELLIRQLLPNANN